MTTKTDGGPAFSVAEMGTHGSYGMSLRDFFAAKAMQAMLTRGAPLDSDQMALDAYVYADAMLAARENT